MMMMMMMMGGVTYAIEVILWLTGIVLNKNISKMAHSVLRGMLNSTPAITSRSVWLGCIRQATYVGYRSSLENNRGSCKQSLFLDRMPVNWMALSTKSVLSG